MATALRKPQAWVTFAKNDEEARQALVLLMSLRRTCTNRKVVLIVSSNLSQVLRNAIETSFDEAYTLTDGTLKDFYMDSVLFAITLVEFEKIVVLSSKALLLENCDELFEYENPVFGENVMILHPDFKHHQVALTAAAKLNYVEKSERLGPLKKVLLQGNTNTSKLPEQFDFSVDLETLKINQEELLLKNLKLLDLKSTELVENVTAPFFKDIVKLKNLLSDCVDHYIKYGQHPNTFVSIKAYKTEPIAIVGMSCRMPGCKNVEDYWKLLEDGKCAVTDIPADRWTKEQNYVLGQQHKNVQAGFLAGRIDEFDAKFFGISPAEAKFTDPQSRLLLEVTWEALEEAGINPQALEGSSTGVFSAAWQLEYKSALHYEKNIFRKYMGNSHGTMGARIAHCLNLSGLNISTESGCSSSAVAVGLAMKSLRNGEVNLALACGVNLLSEPFTLESFMTILSPNHRCKVFDAQANGFVRAEGCGVLVLKRLSDAVANGDKIHALLRGFGMTQEGVSKSMGTPTVEGEALAMQKALEDANVSPNDVQVVEAHGTGTAVGDPVEIKAITKVYSTQERKHPLIVSSGKANTGHTESTFGIAGIIKTILEMKAGIIPPQILIDVINPLIDLEQIPAELAFTFKPWLSIGPKMAGISSFGITGTDTHIILQEPGESSNQNSKLVGLKSPPQNVLTLSAKTKEALEDMVELYKTFLTENKYTISLDDIAYSANTGRAQFSHRIAVWGENCQQILEKFEKRSYTVGEFELNKTEQNICFLFTGQGSQFHGMGKTLYENCPVFKVNFDKCESILKSLYGLQLKDVLWGCDPTKLHQSLYSQCAIFVIEFCLVKVWASWGVVPSCVVGHSLGEFAAATTAGILSLEDALRLLGARCRLIDGLPQGKMIAVKVNQKKAKQLASTFLKDDKNPQYWLDIAAVNSADQTTLSGTEKVVLEFQAFCENNCIKSHVLDATHAFHSRAMDPILSQYRTIAQSIEYNAPTIKFISGLEGKPLQHLDAEYWVKHTREGVQFSNAAACCFQEYETQPVFLEVGPHPVLSALLHANAPPTVQNLLCFPSIKKPGGSKKSTSIEWETMLDTIGKLFVSGVAIKFEEFHRFFPKQKVQLPFYPFQHKRFWRTLSNYTVSKKLFHPLLGSKVPSPNTPENNVAETTRQIRFQNQVSLTTHAYIGDHKLGSFALMPGAGFVEMFLAAATTVSAQEFPIILQDISIKSPFVVDDIIPREIHTVVTYENKSDQQIAKLTTFGREANANDHASWDVHSEATLNLTTSTPETLVNELQVEPLQTLTERFCQEKPENLEIYKQMDALGYKFGKLFKSLGSTWINQKEHLSQVLFPADLHDERDMCHPVLIDSMIQALLLFSEKLTALSLPVAIKSFVLLDTSFCLNDGKETDSPFFLHVKPTDQNELAAVLYKKDGSVVAVMRGVVVVKTSLFVLEKRLEAAKKEHAVPPMYLEEWKRSTVFNHGHYPTPFLMQEKENLQLTYEKNPTDMPGDSLLFKEYENFLKNFMEKKFKKRMLLRIDYQGIAGIILTFIDLGMKQLPLGTLIDLYKLTEELKIIKEMYQPTRRFMEILAENGYFKQSNDDFNLFQVTKKFPSREELSKVHQRFDLETTKVLSSNIEKRFNSFYLTKLGAFLTGKENVLTHLFPKDKSTGDVYPATTIYSDFQTICRIYKLLAVLLPSLLTTCLKNKKSTDGKVVSLRILEVGAGVGSATKIALKALTDLNVKFTYTYTDLSNAFFVKARTTFEPYLKNMEFKVFNMEEDPKAQGFAPNQYDVVISSMAIHATRDLRESCVNIRSLLKNHGLILISEMFTPQVIIDVIFGVLPGYFRQTDVNLRPKHCLIDANKWRKVLDSAGFTKGTLTYNTNGGRSGIVVAQASEKIELYKLPVKYDTEKTCEKVPNLWLIFANSSPFSETLTTRISVYGKTVLTVEETTTGFQSSESHKVLKIRSHIKDDWVALWNLLRSRSLKDEIEGIIYLWGESPLNSGDCVAQTVDSTQKFLFLEQTMWNEWPNAIPKLFLVTRGTFFIGDQAPVVPNNAPLLGMFRVFMSENRALFGKFIDLSPDEIDPTNDVTKVVSELWITEPDHFISYRKDTRHVLKWVPTTTRVALPHAPLALDVTPTSKRFVAVIPKTHSFADLKFESHNNKPILGSFEVEVQVKASALNFRDVLSVLKPTSQFDNTNTIGVDICGVVVGIGSQIKSIKVGDFVLGCNYKNAAMPSHLVMHEDSVVALPPTMTFAEGATLPTVFVTAYHCLVTVGKLKAGEIVLIHTTSGGVGLCALQIARDIGARVIGTAGSKRKRAYLKLVGVEHVFSSRDLTFGEGIAKVTGGKGVDMVLNSLTGPGFKEMSLKCCSKNARFLEMSKLNIWTVDDVKVLRPDVKYSVEDLSTAEEKTMSFLFQELDKYLNHATHPLKPLPYARFDVVDLSSALAYLEKAKQIGKVVCVFPNPPTKDSEPVKINLFNDRSTYLVTGGNGGIGYEVMKWMCKNGAKTVVICGRRPPSMEKLREIELLNKSGKNVLLVEADVGDIEKCRQLLHWIKEKLPPLRGIMHAAGTLMDSMILNQSIEKFEATLNPKVRGGWNLHTLTLDCLLEHFVTFSSVVASLGNKGQSNHAACNTFLDALVSYRRSLGLTGLSINWGQWGEVGVAVGKELHYIYPFTTREGLNALDATLRANATQVIVVDFDALTLTKFIPYHNSCMEQLISSANCGDGGNFELISSDTFWQQLNTAENDAKRCIIISKCLACILNKLLRLEEDISPTQNFQDLGMDSLMTIELKNQIQNLLGNKATIRAMDMNDCNTLDLTVNKIMDIIYSRNSNSLNSRNELIYEDSILWETVDISDATPPVPIQQVSVVFMTGCTGNLGPYLLSQLTNYAQVQKVFCLVRPSNLNSGYERLVARLEYLNLLGDTITSKISVVEGSIVEDLFGLGEQQYNMLAEEVDAIIHCAVHTGHIEMYGQGASKKTGIKAVNVHGTQRVLEFASKTKVKHVYNGSSMLGAWYSKEHLSRVKVKAYPEEWPEHGDADDAPSFGYAISKFISDRLVGQAVGKGIPCKSFRFPKIVGEKATGKQEIVDNHCFIKFMYFMQAGIIPDLEVPLQVIPVDTCAELSLRLFFDPAVPSELFNILNPHHEWETKLAELTPEYGPLLRIAKHLWQVMDKIVEFDEIEPESVMPTFVQLLNQYCIHEDIDLEPFLGLLDDLDGAAFFKNPSIALKNDKIRAALRKNYGYQMRIVPYEEFCNQLAKDGEGTALSKWIEFYTREDALYKVMQNGYEWFDYYKAHPLEALANAHEKATKYIPQYKNIISPGLEIVKKDFEYAIDHAVETFRRLRSPA